MSQRSIIHNLSFFFGMQKMSDKCFRKCVNYPGSELDTRESVSGWSLLLSSEGGGGGGAWGILLPHNLLYIL